MNEQLLHGIQYHLFAAALLSIEYDPRNVEYNRLREATNEVVRANNQWRKAAPLFLAGKPTDEIEARARELYLLAMDGLHATDASVFPYDTRLIIAAIKAVHEQHLKCPPTTTKTTPMPPSGCAA